MLFTDTSKTLLDKIEQVIRLIRSKGVGIYFISVAVLISLIFTFSGSSYLFMMILVLLSMLFGFLDDRSKNPWGEYIKGALDFLIAGIGAAVFTIFYGTDVVIGITGATVTIPTALFFFLAVMLIIVSVNATNATDGVDGLSGTLTILTLITFMVVAYLNGTLTDHGIIRGLVLIFALIAYLIFNFNPSKVLMGDAGSRALGVLLALMCLKTGSPLIFIPFAFMLIVDGGMGLIKVSFIRFLKIKGFMKNIRTPIHDHVRKNKGWSDTQVVTRFSIVQIIICICYYMICN